MDDCTFASGAYHLRRHKALGEPVREVLVSCLGGRSKLCILQQLAELDVVVPSSVLHNGVTGVETQHFHQSMAPLLVASRLSTDLHAGPWLDYGRTVYDLRAHASARNQLGNHLLHERKTAAESHLRCTTETLHSVEHVNASDLSAGIGDLADLACACLPPLLCLAYTKAENERLLRHLDQLWLLPALSVRLEHAEEQGRLFHARHDSCSVCNQ